MSLSASKLHPIFSRSKPQVPEPKRPPSIIPDHIRAPPGTPTSELQNATGTESDNDDAHDESPHNPNPPAASAESNEHVPPEPHEPKTTGRRKPRKKGRKLFKPSLILENSGSVARDHLASERTFLAYIRTSLLLASTGSPEALVQLFAVASANPQVSATLGHVRQFARPLGATMVVFGLCILIVGVRRYFRIQKYLTQGKFPVTRFAIAGIAIGTAIIIIIVFGVLVSAKKN
ncbi:hypothetical protein DXG01_003122 [Tephrocybe rancida]|nr:hypothetical protein DXG01_003122 [Tephrocybe rancida]